MKTTRTPTFRSLTVRNFRLFAAGQLVSVAGTWMMVVSQDWLVLELTGDSATALGTLTALQFTPMLLLTLYGGRLADRYDKRLLLTLANLVSGALALALAVLVLADAVRLWHLYLFALGLGTVNAFEVPARMSFVGELVGPELLPNASALSAAYFNTARVAGPALAGLLISASGTGPVMVLNAVSHLATVAALRMIRPGELIRSRPAGRASGVRDGLRYVRTRPDLVAVLGLLAVVGLLGFNFQLTLPLLAKTVLAADATAFGLLTTAFAAGSLLAAFASTARRGRPTARTVAGSALAFGVAETAAGWAPDYASAAVLLALTGFAGIYFAQAANHRVQLGSAPHYRGRVLALYTLILQGLTPLGALLVGWLSARHGARAGLWVGGTASATAALAALLGRPRRRGRPSPTTGGTGPHRRIRRKAPT
ncbi:MULTISPECIES: MFS transporter [Streptomyces]|uniref:MFS transporter n=1 Tax=Streptomyces TaxID=1883 RepID=UPI001316C0F1|nr:MULTISPECIES: MFS transporter [Streptomyces]QGZ49423.1 MFS transporter [Streptomyces sp. QHH-9511]GGU17068.1 MFS transporter [Streptomyces lateritius]